MDRTRKLIDRAGAAPPAEHGERPSPANPEPLLIGEREAAATLGISPRLLWTLRQEGKIAFVRVGARVLYSPERLREWIACNSEGGTR